MKNVSTELRFGLVPAAALLAAAAALILATACGSDDGGPAQVPTDVPDPDPDPLCDPTITVPNGLCARVYFPSVGAARHLAVAPNGDVFVAIRNSGGQRGGVIALRDLDGDGRADQTQAWGDDGGSGLSECKIQKPRGRTSGVGGFGGGECGGGGGGGDGAAGGVGGGAGGEGGGVGACIAS